MRMHPFSSWNELSKLTQLPVRVTLNRAKKVSQNCKSNTVRPAKMIVDIVSKTIYTRFEMTHCTISRCFVPSFVRMNIVNIAKNHGIHRMEQVTQKVGC